MWPAIRCGILGMISTVAKIVTAETQNGIPRGLPEDSKKRKKNTALKYIIDVWLHWELESFEAIF